MIASELVLEQGALAMSLPLLGDLIAPLFETGRVNSRISASDTSFSERATEFLRSSQFNNYEQTNSSFSGETSNTVFTSANTGQQIKTAKAPIVYTSAATNRTPLDSATQIDPLTGNSAEQALVGKVATNYTYRDVTASITSHLDNRNKKIRLESLQTNANNIELRPNNTTVPNSGSFGVNGGFFQIGTNTLFSIAVNNDRPVYGLPGATGVGWGNSKTRGTLYWDGQTNTAGIAVVDHASQLKTIVSITNTANY